jgi:hypothetical protein
VPGSDTITVWLYDSTMGAAADEVRLRELRARGEVAVVDAITVTWVPGTHQPIIGHLRRRGPEGAARRSALRILLGAPPSPTAEPAAGDGAVMVTAPWANTDDVGFARELERRMTPGTSALLALSAASDLVPLRLFVERGLARGHVSLVDVWLPEDLPDRQRELLESAVRHFDDPLAHSG